jgi:hypothetical protein
MPGDNKTVEQIVAGTRANGGKVRCLSCFKAYLKEQAKAKAQANGDS